MPIYGYQRRRSGDDDDGEPELLELQEVTFDLRPEDLRRVAAFLQHFATGVADSSWRSDHAHIEQFDSDWVKRNPGLTVVVMLHEEPAAELRTSAASEIDA